MTEENKKVEQFSTFYVNLPSRGKLYSKDSPLREGKVEMRMGTANEEDIIMNKSYINKQIVFDKLLDSLLVNESINVSNLIIGDWNTLVISARKSMYDSEIDVEVTCPKCGETEKVRINTDKFEMFIVPDDTEKNEFEFESKFGNKFKYHILTVGENRDIIKGQKRKQKMTGTKKTSNITDRLVAHIDELNGDRSKSKIRKYVKNGNMPSIESKNLRDDILKNSPDIDMTKRYSCSSCNYDGRVDIPLSIDFFWGSGDEDRRRSRRSI